MAKKKSMKCKLFPFERVDCLSVQEIKQKAGWNITAFDLPDIWKYSQGEGVKVAVLDSGIDFSHNDLDDNIISGYNFVENGEPPVDRQGHGTFCAGIIAAENNDLGVVGVAPKTKIMPVKVLDDNGNGNLLSVSNGIRWAADHGADFICMSLGTPIKVQQVRKAVQYALSKGTICFAAAGNIGKTKEIFYPANYPEVISTGAVDKHFNRANFSNSGMNLDFMAPGVDILSTVPPNWYANMSGTSMSNPWVVGVAALLLSYTRNNKSKLVLKTPDDYREVFRKHCIPIKNKNLKENKFYQGFGIIDPRLFLEAMKSHEVKNIRHLKMPH